MVRSTARSLLAQCLLAAIVVGCGSDSGREGTPDTGPGECCTPPIETILITEAPDSTPPPISTEPSTSAVVVTEPDVDGIMPDVLCLDLQEAQNMIQTRGVFFSRSEDASGEGRRQIIDSNWVVVAQTPAAGESIGEGDAVLSVLKDAEVTECVPGVGGS